MRKIKTGIASFGMSGMVFHAPLLHVHPGFEISAVLERNSDRSVKIYPYVRILRSWESMLSDQEIELIIVNTPDNLHAEMCSQALDAGKHIVVEKPFTLTSSEADGLIRKASDRNLLISVFQNRRWDGDFLTIQDLLSKNMLGRLVEYEAHFDRYRNFIQDNTWKEQSASGTGLLFNLGSHLIDQAMVLFGLPVSVTADLRKQRTGTDIDDAFTLWLNYPDVKVTLKSGYLVRKPIPRYVLHGTLGSFHKTGIDPQESDLKAGAMPDSPDWGKDDEAEWGWLDTEANGVYFQGRIETLPGNYIAFYQSIYESMISGKELAVTATQARDVIRVIEAAFKSQEEQKAIKL